MKPITAAVITLGCRLNQADSALLNDRLIRLGFQIVSPDASSSPNLILVNSCTVTETAYKKSKQALRSIRAENPQSFIVFTGCAADVSRDELEQNQDIDLVLTNEQKKDIEAILPEYLALLEKRDVPAAPKLAKGIFAEQAQGVFPFRSRAFIKVQEGCNNNCSYCIVPAARGPERSRDLKEITAEFTKAVADGFHEIVLTGVNTCHYKAGKVGMPELIDRLCGIPGDFRIRLSSTEPCDEIFPIVDAMNRNAAKVCEFLHLPLQSGCDRILKKMNRHCDTAKFAEYAAYAREAIPNLHLGTDVIVGFPGETDADFEKSLAFLRKMDFANIHVFPYSPRSGTPAADMPDKVQKTVVADRIEQLKALKEECAQKFAKGLVGTTGAVLIETNCNKKELWDGWSGNYVRTIVSSESDISRRLLRVKFQRFLPVGALFAEIIGDPG
jgi:threonylcarbamoyladenosine tRNA methylthiotransferase MtaB